MEHPHTLASRVRDWWNDNPFVYSFDKKDIEPDEHFFNEIDRKFIKWTPWAQDDARPLSRIIQFEELRGKRVLDIAIGTGWSTEQFARAGADVAGIDITPRAIELAKRRFQVRGMRAPDLRVVDAQALPYPDGSFDFVLAWGCLMHMPDTQKAIAEIHRVLKPGGRVAAMMYNKHSLHWWYYIVLSKGIMRGKLFTMSLQQLANRYTDGVYQGGNQLTKFFSRHAVRSLFKDFHDVRIQIHDTTTPIDHFPHRRLAVGRFLPLRIRRACMKLIGQSLWITART